MPLLPGSSTAQSIALGAASVQSTVLAEYQVYRLAASGNCWVKFGSNPTSVAGAADNHYIAAGQVIKLRAGGSGASLKVAVIQDGAATGYLVISLAAPN